MVHGKITENHEGKIKLSESRNHLTDFHEFYTINQTNLPTHLSSFIMSPLLVSEI